MYLLLQVKQNKSKGGRGDSDILVYTRMNIGIKNTPKKFKLFSKKTSKNDDFAQFRTKFDHLKLLD